MPQGPWERVAGDFFGPLDDGTYWFVNICEYSRFPLVDKITSTAAIKVIPLLRHIFSVFGTPDIYKSDNGPPFFSWEFAQFADEYDFKHQKSTPYWPRANGDAENFMKNLGKILKVAKINKKNKDTALSNFLRTYRATPHTATKFAPAMLLMGYSRTSGIPMVNDNISGKSHELIHQQAILNDEVAKKRMQVEYDYRMKVREPRIREGDLILLNLAKKNKCTPRWDPNPY